MRTFRPVLALATLLICARFQARAATQSETMEFDGRTRSFLVHLPSRHDSKHSLPIVMVLHGGTQSPESAERMSGMSGLADREGFIAVYPTGTSRMGLAPTWNAGNCCGYALINHVDDIGFLRALITKLESEYNVDRHRIYATGISNGGMLSFRAACELSDVIAAVAPVEGAQNVECHPKSPVSVLIFHGTADKLVPFDGGSTPFQSGPKRSDTPVRDAVRFWVQQDGCSPALTHEERPDVHIDRYGDCLSGTAVVLYAIQGGHHMWPGLRVSGNQIPATEIMWKFFTEHPKP